MKVTIEGTPKEIAALATELQERLTGEFIVSLDALGITHSVLAAIRGKSEENTGTSDQLP